MADRKRITALKASEWQHNIQEDDFGSESDIASDTDVYNFHNDNRNNLESESSSDNESLVSKSSNSEISDFGRNETSSEADKIHVHQYSTTSFVASAGIT